MASSTGRFESNLFFMPCLLRDSENKGSEGTLLLVSLYFCFLEKVGAPGPASSVGESE